MKELVFCGKKPTVVLRNQGMFLQSELVGQPNDGTRLVETAGYVDKTTQIRNLLLSGERLNSYLKRIYPSKDPIDNEDITELEREETLSLYPDLIEAEEAIIGIRTRNLKRQKRAREEYEKKQQDMMREYQLLKEQASNNHPPAQAGEGAVNQ